MEAYIDDIVVKSKRANVHEESLNKNFQRIRHPQLELNPLKCAFGVLARNFLGFLAQ